MFGRSCFPAVALVLAIGALAASRAHSQSVVGVDAGSTTLSDEYESVSLFEVGLRFGSLTRKHVNADVHLATAPQALTVGALVLAADIDAAYVLPLGKDIDATPRAGFSMVAAVGSGGGAGVPGINYGVGVVARLNTPLAIRFDYSHRTFLTPGEGESIGTSSFLIGIAVLHWPARRSCAKST